jgi:Putative zinc-finger
MTVHEHVQQTLSAWLDGQANPEQRFLAERHLQQCHACRATVAAFAQIDALAREVLLPTGPPPFEVALAERLAAEPTHVQHPVRVRHQRLRHRLWLAGVAAVLVVLALVVVSIVVSPAGRWPLPVPTTAPAPAPQQLDLAAVVARAERAASGVRTLQGRFTRTWSGMPSRSGSTGTVTSRYRFVFASPDRVRVVGDPGAEVRLEIYDGPAGRRLLQLREDPRPLVSTGVPLVRPQDQDALASLSEGLTLWFRNRLEDPDQPASLTTHEGRQVYVLRLRYEWSVVAGPARITHLEVWLDPTAYLPTRIQYQDRSKPGRVVLRGDVRYTDQRVNSPVPPGAFAVPAGAEFHAAGRFRSLPLARARALASYKVPQVTRLPRPDWRLLRAGFAPVGFPTGSEGSNPQGRDLVVAVYGSGLERLVLTTLLVTDQELGHQQYGDPFGAEGIQRITTRYRLRAGAYAGTVVRLGLPSDDAPYLWFRSGKVVVTLSGAASRQELIAAAESLTL